MCLDCFFCIKVGNLHGLVVPRYPFKKCGNGISVSFSLNSIKFPVPKDFSVVHFIWPFVDTHSVWNLWMTSFSPIPNSSFVSVPRQVVIQLLFLPIFRQVNVAVNGFMTDHGFVLFFFQSASNLFWTP